MFKFISDNKIAFKNIVSNYETVKILFVLILIFSLASSVVSAYTICIGDEEYSIPCNLINNPNHQPIPDFRRLNGWLIKTDANGDVMWSRTFDGAIRDSSDGFNYVQQTSDGGYLLPGITNSGYAWLIKTDTNGNEQWKKTYEYYPSGFNYAQQTKDGGYILSGSFYSKGGIMKTDSTGNEQWNKIFRGNPIYSVQQTLDSGYILADGSTVRKLDSKGNEQWNKSFSWVSSIGDDFFIDYASIKYVKGTKDGGHLSIGSDEGTIGENYYKHNIWLFKTDIKGNEIWRKSFENAGSETIDSVQPTKDDGYIILSSQKDSCLIKTNATGDVLWKKNVCGEHIQQTSDGGYILLSSYEAQLIKTDINGNLQWNKTYGTEWLSVNSVQQTLDGGYILAGQGYGTVLSESSIKKSSTPTLVPTQTLKTAMKIHNASSESSTKIASTPTSTPILVPTPMQTAAMKPDETPGFKVILTGALILIILVKRKILAYKK